MKIILYSSSAFIVSAVAAFLLSLVSKKAQPESESQVLKSKAPASQIYSSDRSQRAGQASSHSAASSQSDSASSSRSLRANEDMTLEGALELFALSAAEQEEMIADQELVREMIANLEAVAASENAEH